MVELFCDIVAQDILDLVAKNRKLKDERAEAAAQDEQIDVGAQEEDGEPDLYNAALFATARSRRDKQAAADKAGVGRQARGNKVEQIVPEYKAVAQIPITPEEKATLENLKRHKKGEVADDIQLKAGKLHKGQKVENILENGGKSAAVIGTHWEPAEFLERASWAEHPYHQQAAVPDRTLRAIFNTLTKGIEATKVARRETLRRMRKRAQELDAEERRQFQVAHPTVKPCWYGSQEFPEDAVHDEKEWEGKRTILLSEVAQESGFRSAAVLKRYQQAGIPVFGEVPRCVDFQAEEHMAELTMQELMMSSKWAIATAKATARSSANPEIDLKVWEKTQVEVKAGKARGPFRTVEEVQAHVGKLFVPARRVGIQQGGDVRPIDDFSEFGHNGTSTTHDYIDLGGVDRVVGIAKTWLDAVGEDGWTKVKLSTGEELQGQVHEDFRTLKSRAPVGRAVDISKAFKQLAPHPSMQHLTVIFLANPHTK